MRRANSFCLALVCALATGIGAAHGAPITIYNTGVDNSGTPLAHGTVGDPHYSLISVPGGSAQTRIITSAGGFPIGPYLGDNTTSAWIGPNNDDDLNGPPGTYIYRTTFDLTGLDPNTASISGGWTSDNGGIDILLNGVSIGAGSTASNQFQLGFAPFSINSGFVSGINTLDFVVGNDPPGNNPTALRVEFTSATANLAVAEPSSAAVACIAMAVACGCFLARRRRSPANV